MTANGEVQTNEEAQVYVQDLDLFVTVPILEETPPVLSLGKLVQKSDIHMGENRWNTTFDQKWEYYYVRNEKLRTSRRAKIEIIFRQQLGFYIENQGSVKFFQWIEKTHQTEWQLEVPSQHAEGPCKQISKRRPRETVVQWTKTRWTRKIQRNVFLTGHSPSQIILRTWRRMCPHTLLKKRTQIRKALQRWWHIGRTVFVLTSPKTEIATYARGPKLRGFCRWRSEGSIQRAVKFGDLITTDHKILNDGGQSQNKHRSWYKIAPLSGYSLIRVKPKLHRRRGAEPTTISWAVTEPKNYLHWQFIGIWQILSRIIMESSDFHTSKIRKTNGIAERAVRTVKERTLAVLLQSGLDEKRWTKIWRIIQRTNYSIRRTSGVSPKLRERQSENPSFRKEKYYH